MKVFVTGGAGYIGSTLVRLLLEKGYDVTVLDRFFFGKETLKDVEDQVTLIKDDIRWFNPDLLTGIDAVIDLAALSNDPAGELNPDWTMDINYKGRVRVATLAKKKGVNRYVLASSCSVYGFQEGILNESSATNPLTTYAKANKLAEEGVLPLADKNFTVTALRQATVYGYSSRMRFDLAINGMVKSFFQTGKVRVMRDGKQWRPFVHVKDTSNAFIKVLESEKDLINGEIFNVGSNEQNYQIFNLAKLIAEAINVPFNYEWYGDLDKRSYRVDFTKIKEKLGYKPQYTPKEGAKEVYDALKNGILDPENIKTITVKWYKKLIEMWNVIKDVEINNRLF